MAAVAPELAALRLYEVRRRYERERQAKEDPLATSPLALAEAVKGEFGIAAYDDWQVELLESRAKQIILCCGRQIGKSSTVAMRIMHTALYQPKSSVLLVSPSLRQSQLLFKRCMLVYRALGRPVHADIENRLSLELENGSEIASLPGAEGTIRGFSAVRLLVLDEASRIPDDIYLAVRPMLAMSDGDLMVLSTPYGRRGFFHQEWTAGGAGWHRIKATADQYAYRYKAGFLEAERRYGEAYYKQEYLGEFVETVDNVFPYDLIARSVRSDVPALFGDLQSEDGVLADELDQLPAGLLAG